MEASLWLKEKSQVSLKVGCLPYAVGKQRSIPLINFGRKWTLKKMMMLTCWKFAAKCWKVWRARSLKRVPSMTSITKAKRIIWHVPGNDSFSCHVVTVLPTLSRIWIFIIYIWIFKSCSVPVWSPVCCSCEYVVCPSVVLWEKYNVIDWKFLPKLFAKVPILCFSVVQVMSFLKCIIYCIVFLMHNNVNFAWRT